MGFCHNLLKLFRLTLLAQIQLHSTMTHAHHDPPPLFVINHMSKIQQWASLAETAEHQDQKHVLEMLTSLYRPHRGADIPFVTSRKPQSGLKISTRTLPK
jgi:hypothetical protein